MKIPWFMQLSVMWHIYRNPGHHSLPRRVSVPMFDPGARGILIKCSGCDKVWAA